MTGGGGSERQGVEGGHARAEAEELMKLAQQHRARLRAREEDVSASEAGKTCNPTPKEAYTSVKRGLCRESKSEAGETVFGTDMDVDTGHTVLAERQLRLRFDF